MKKSLKGFIKITPNLIEMVPNKKYEFTIEITCKERMLSFSEKVIIDV